MIDAAGTLAYDKCVAAIVAPASERKTLLENSRVVWPGPTTATTIEYGEFTPHFTKLRRLGSEPSLWPDGVEGPSQAALAMAGVILKRFFARDLAPTKVVASAEGGAALCFVAGNKYADIESLNSGEILGVLSDKSGRPVAWEIEPSPDDIARAVERIREFIHAS